MCYVVVFSLSDFFLCHGIVRVSCWWFPECPLLVVFRVSLLVVPRVSLASVFSRVSLQMVPRVSLLVGSRVSLLMFPQVFPAKGNAQKC